MVVLGELLKFCNMTNMEKRDDVLDGLCEDFNDSIGTSVKAWIEKYEPCYQGLRSLRKRIVELERLSMVRGHIASAKKGSEADIERVINLDFMPDHLRMQYNRLYAEKKSFVHHTESEVLKKFGSHLKAFNDDMKNLEDSVCDICSQYTVRSEIATKKGHEIDDKFLLSSMKNARTLDVCRMCWREMRDGKFPPGALVNGMLSDEAPTILKSLNNIEGMLIKRFRAIQNIFHLRDIGGRKTSMKGTKGVLTLVPVAIDETVEHVADVLPSASKMTIHVSTPWDKTYIVCMDRVVKALHWLKENNPEYADIIIDERFKFELGKNVIFEKDGATEDDVENLILRGKSDDLHLLTQEAFEEVQPLKEVIPIANDGSLALEKFVLKV